MDELLDDIWITSFIVQHPKPSMAVIGWISHKLLNPAQHLSSPQSQKQHLLLYVDQVEFLYHPDAMVKMGTIQLRGEGM